MSASSRTDAAQAERATTRATETVPDAAASWRRRRRESIASITPREPPLEEPPTLVQLPFSVFTGSAEIEVTSLAAGAAVVPFQTPVILTSGSGTPRKHEKLRRSCTPTCGAVAAAAVIPPVSWTTIDICTEKYKNRQIFDTWPPMPNIPCRAHMTTTTARPSQKSR